MPQDPSATDLRGKQLTAPVQITGVTVTPSQGLFQPPFEMSEADFLRLKHKGPVTSLGAAIIGFALTYTLPLLAQRFFPTPGDGPISNCRWTVAAISLGIGFLVWGIGLFGSRERRTLMKKIERHFHENPNQKMSVRSGRNR